MLRSDKKAHPHASSRYFAHCTALLTRGERDELLRGSCTHTTTSISTPNSFLPSNQQYLNRTWCHGWTSLSSTCPRGQSVRKGPLRLAPTWDICNMEVFFIFLPLSRYCNYIWEGTFSWTNELDRWIIAVNVLPTSQHVASTEVLPTSQHVASTEVFSSPGALELGILSCQRHQLPTTWERCPEHEQRGTEGTWWRARARHPGSVQRDNEVSIRSAGHSAIPFRQKWIQVPHQAAEKRPRLRNLLLVIALGSDRSWCAIAWLVNPRVLGFWDEVGYKRPFNFRVISRMKSERSMSESPSWTPAIFLLSPTVV